MFLKSSKASSRYQIQIKEVRDGVLMLPGNNYRAVLETSALNFELKSDKEQDVITDNFQSFLNSLPCSIQILVRVRAIDIEKYIEDFEQKTKNEKHDIYKNQLKDYSKFIRKLVTGNKIMSRKFYIVITFDNRGKKFDFDQIKEQFRLSEDIITKSLEKINIKTKRLPNIELIRLFYEIYNHGKVKTQPLNADLINILETDYVV